MTRLLNRASDRMLALFAPKAQAGACVPEHGEACWRDCGTCSCVPNQRWVKKQCRGTISCTGPCTGTSATRCVTTQNIC